MKPVRDAQCSTALMHRPVAVCVTRPYFLNRPFSIFLYLYLSNVWLELRINIVPIRLRSSVEKKGKECLIDFEGKFLFLFINIIDPEM